MCVCVAPKLCVFFFSFGNLFVCLFDFSLWFYLRVPLNYSPDLECSIMQADVQGKEEEIKSKTEKVSDG